MYCLKCSKEIENPNAKFCPFCGSPLAASSSVEPEEVSQTNKSSSPIHSSTPETKSESKIFPALENKANIKDLKKISFSAGTGKLGIKHKMPEKTHPSSNQEVVIESIPVPPNSPILKITHIKDKDYSYKIRKVYVAVIVLLCFIALLYTMFSSKKNNDSEESQVTATPSAEISASAEIPKEEPSVDATLPTEEPAKETATPTPEPEIPQTSESDSSAVQWNDVTVASVKASDTLVEKGWNYDAQNVLDGDLTTCWAFHNRSGEYLTFELENETEISAVAICNGYGLDDDRYYNNNRVVEINVAFDDGAETLVLDPSQCYDNYKNGSLTFLLLAQPHKSAKVCVTVTQTLAGEKFNDTCISELHFLQTETDSDNSDV